MLIQGNAMHLPIASGVVQCCITSPPYWGLRSYATAKWVGGDPSCDHKGSERYYTEQTAACAGSSEAFAVAGEANAERVKRGRWREGGVCRCGAVYQDAQLGLEKTPDEYVANLVAVFREVWRVLKDSGTVWIVIGDSYASNPGKGGSGTPNGRNNRGENYGRAHRNGAGRADGIIDERGQRNRDGVPTSHGLKAKDLCMIPARVALALQADGWYLRSDIIYSKTSCMPESVTDRPTRSHEYVFLLAKQERYYYDADAIKEPSSGLTGGVFGYGGEEVGRLRHDAGGARPEDYGTRNKRTVWTIAPQQFRGAHFAAYPEALVTPCILAGSREGDLVLDPFAGSGTTLVVCRRFNRRGVGIELSAEYCDLARRRIRGLGVVDRPVTAQMEMF